MIESLLAAGVGLGRTLIGIVMRPYETYRRIVDRASLSEVALIGLLLVAFSAATSLWSLFVVGTAVLAICLFWIMGQRVGATGSLKGFVAGWAYTLIPTLVWFVGTGFLSVIFPPPRTNSPQGMLLSAVFLLFSATMLFWKIILSYLALRFGLKLDLVRISIVSAVVLPMLGIYSVLMYRLGIFRIPFV